MGFCISIDIVIEALTAYKAYTGNTTITRISANLLGDVLIADEDDKSLIFDPDTKKFRELNPWRKSGEGK